MNIKKTDRNKEIVHLVESGSTMSEVARAFGISPSRARQIVLKNSCRSKRVDLPSWSDWEVRCLRKFEELWPHPIQPDPPEPEVY